MKTIRNQLSLVFTLLFVICSIILVVSAELLLKETITEQLVNSLKRECRFLSSLVVNQPVRNKDFLKEFSREQELRLTLIDSTGHVMFDTWHDVATAGFGNHNNREEVEAARADASGFGTSTRFSHTELAEMLFVARELSNGYVVRLSHNLEFVQEYVRRIRSLLIIATLVATGIAVILIFRVSEFITKPIRALTLATIKIRDGNYKVTLPENSPNEIGRLSKAINAMTDRLKTTIDTLEAHQEVRKTFIANASHELKTPVASVRGYLETLQDGALEDNQVNRRFIHRSLRNLDRLELIISDMLTLSRLESGSSQESFRFLDLEQYVGGIVEDFQSRAKEKNLSLFMKSNMPRGTRICIDPTLFDKALLNLLDNAIKYTDTGAITVSLELQDKQCNVVVHDTGRGISETDLPRIFERFYRIDKARSRELGGSGLGLAIVKHVMSLHKGTVSVESESGNGSTFTLSFPV